MADNPPIPIEALEGLMKKAFVEASSDPGLFWDALLKSNLYIPLKGTKAELQNLGEDEKSKLPMLLGLSPQNQYVVWLFTSPEVMRSYIEENYPFLEILAPKLLSKVAELDYEVVLIGPNELTLSLDPKLIQSLADGQVPDMPKESVKSIPKDTEVYVGPPQDETTVLEKVFVELFQSMPEVFEASFIQIKDETGSRLLLGVRLQEESREILHAVTEKIARVAEGVLPAGKSLDVTFINGSLKEAFQKWGQKFFYRETK